MNPPPNLQATSSKDRRPGPRQKAPLAALLGHELTPLPSARPLIGTGMALAILAALLLIGGGTWSSTIF